MMYKIFSSFLFTTGCLFLFSSCEKLLEVDPPINSISTEEIFFSDKQAEWAVAGIYTKMINGGAASGNEPLLSHTIFSAGLSTLQGGLSADEITLSTDQNDPDYYSQINKLSLINNTKINELWLSAYRSVYDANAVLDGIAGSTTLSGKARKQFTGEALALRAFCYFYLVNFYGDLPIALSSDVKETYTLSRSPVSKVYSQIKSDLEKARSLLDDDLAAGNNERVRINKWFAEALLARVYLYTGEYQAAINSASAVINHTSLFQLEQDVDNSFLPNSSEAIFQLKPSMSQNLGNATPEGYMFSRTTLSSPEPVYKITSQLLNAFETGDKRKAAWTASMGNGIVPVKYSNGWRSQYYTVMRLAELYLIRAEATALFTPAAKNNAIDDLNMLRRRAGVTELDYQMTAGQVLEAVAHERRVELFLEWGHRWFDLKRTGRAHDVLSIVPYKQPWAGDYQLLYPIPEDDLKLNTNLIQNPEYNNR